LPVRRFWERAGCQLPHPRACERHFPSRIVEMVKGRRARIDANLGHICARGPSNTVSPLGPLVRAIELGHGRTGRSEAAPRYLFWPL
jgi:hypothetical protein